VGPEIKTEGARRAVPYGLVRGGGKQTEALISCHKSKRPKNEGKGDD